ncbi:DUF4838 domain-containing protein [Spongiimicrobium sp. 3-5]|uniref:DUF4838 domain-containing protein n=1 Tax=Spongiimicrobium sp. 3-5 TaxID=3332596 RepID=UPI00397F7690
MKKSVFTLLINLVLFLTWSCTNNAIELVKNGASDYEIVLLDNFTEDTRKTAEKLQYYIHKISDVSIEIVDGSSQNKDKSKIFVGLLDAPKQLPRQINIKTEGKDLFITGGSENAVKNAVYEFLENFLGCKWYTPEVAKTPNTKTISLKPIDYTYDPAINTRTVHSRLYYENKEFADQQKVTYEAFPYYVPIARVHTFHRFMPEEKFYGDHPEYYALRGENRLPTQLCLTNEKVLEIVKDSVSALFSRYPDADVVSVSQDDNQQYCQCENCSKIDKEEGGPSGTMVHFVNKVAADFPEKTISTLAYQHTRKPPKVRPADNVLITLCSIECDRSSPIEAKCTDFADDLKGWGKLTDNIRIWDYTTQFTNFLAPFPNIHTLQPNIQLFKDNNAKWVFEQHSNNPSELFELRSYITAKLLWNPDLNLDALLSEFTDGYYKEAGVYVKKYIDRIHAELKKNEDFFLFLYGDPSEAFSSYLSPESLAEYTQIFDAAEKAVAYDPKIVSRVKMARLGVDYAVLEASRKNISPTYSLTVQDNVINPKVTALLDNFMETTSDNNITLMNEMGFTADEYATNYLSALEIAQKPNKAKGKKVISVTQPKKYADEDPMVLTDGALGGSSFYANWLGYEGNRMEVIIDLEEEQTLSTVSLAFLQVTNHVVFFPSSVTYQSSSDGKNYQPLGVVENPSPLTKTSKVNDIQYFDINFKPTKARYIKVIAQNTETPYWHHAAGLPSWIFADEIIID